MIKRLLQQHAKNMPTPDDWVYVNNFKNPRQPLALRFPAGQGKISKCLASSLANHFKTT